MGTLCAIQSLVDSILNGFQKTLKTIPNGGYDVHIKHLFVVSMNSMNVSWPEEFVLLCQDFEFSQQNTGLPIVKCNESNCQYTITILERHMDTNTALGCAELNITLTPFVLNNISHATILSTIQKHCNTVKAITNSLYNPTMVAEYNIGHSIVSGITQTEAIYVILFNANKWMTDDEIVSNARALNLFTHIARKTPLSFEKQVYNFRAKLRQLAGKTQGKDYFIKKSINNTMYYSLSSVESNNNCTLASIKQCADRIIEANKRVIQYDKQRKTLNRRVLKTQKTKTPTLKTYSETQSDGSVITWKSNGEIEWLTNDARHS